MRELTKAFNRYSWSVTLFGLNQACSFLVPGRTDGEPRTDPALSSVSQAAEGELSGLWKRSFEAGDELQRAAVDAGFGLVDGTLLSPRRTLDLSTEILRRSVAAAAAFVPGGAGRSEPGEPCGWGPMPPAR